MLKILFTLLLFPSFIIAMFCNSALTYAQESTLPRELCHKVLNLKNVQKCDCLKNEEAVAKKLYNDFVLEGADLAGGDTAFPTIDIDADGKIDSVIRSCGNGVDASCYIFVTLSSGHKIKSQEMGIVSLAMFDKRLYVVENMKNIYSFDVHAQQHHNDHQYTKNNTNKK